MDTLDRFREKWREVPGGDDVDGRVYSDDLMALSDAELLARWEAMAARRAGGVVGRMEPLYRDFFRDSHVLEIGGGLGFDGLRFAAQGAFWTFADIVPGNLAVIDRVASLKGLTVGLQKIGEDLSFCGEFDAIVAIGSIHHVPFDVARKEALNALSCLKIGGRWIELVYPRERWLREGSMPFDQWGSRTDGERTPWVEWYDAEKVRHRLRPAILKTILDMELASHSHRWLDFRYEGMGREVAGFVDLLSRPVVLDGGERDGWSFTGKPGAFFPIGRVAIGGVPAVVDLVLNIREGAVGVGLVGPDGEYLADTEVVLAAQPDNHLVTLRSDEPAAALAFRNRHQDRGSAFAVLAARLRE